MEDEKKQQERPPVSVPGEMYQDEHTEFPHDQVEGAVEMPLLSGLAPGFWGDVKVK